MNGSSNQLRFGPYVTPVVTEGVVVECEVRGLVQIVGLSDAAIRWPIGERDGQRELIVFKALARALRQETPQAVALAWGVPLDTAQHWKEVCHRPRLRKKQTAKTLPIRWKPEDDELLIRVSLAEAARLTGRTLTAVRKRRRALGLPDGRMAEQKALKSPYLSAKAALTKLHSHAAALHESIAELRQTMVQAKASAASWHRAKSQQGRPVFPLLSDGAPG